MAVQQGFGFLCISVDLQPLLQQLFVSLLVLSIAFYRIAHNNKTPFIGLHVLVLEEVLDILLDSEIRIMTQTHLDPSIHDNMADGEAAMKPVPFCFGVLPE